MTTTTPTLDDLKRLFAPVRVPDGKGGTWQPLMENVRHVNYYLDGKPIYCEPARSTRSCDRCHGTGLVPRAYDIADVIVAIAKTGLECSVAVRVGYAWAKFHRMAEGGRLEYRSEDVPIDVDSIFYAVLTAAIDAARARGALPKEAVDA